METKMKQEYLKLLGVKVLPIVKRSQYGASEFDVNGQLNFLRGEEQLLYGKRVIDNATKEQRKENKEQEWIVWSIQADGRFNLRSDLGYEQENVRRNDFRIIKN